MARRHMKNHLLDKEYYKYHFVQSELKLAKSWYNRFAYNILVKCKQDNDWKQKNIEQIKRIFRTINERFKQEADITTKKCCMCSQVIGAVSFEEWERRSKRFMLGICGECEKQHFPYN